MHHKTALNKDSRYPFIKSSEESTRETYPLSDGANDIDAAVRIIKNSLCSKGSSPLLFQIGEDDCLYQITGLKGTCFQRFEMVSDINRR